MISENYVCIYTHSKHIHGSYCYQVLNKIAMIDLFHLSVFLYSFLRSSYFSRLLLQLALPDVPVPISKVYSSNSGQSIYIVDIFVNKH